MAMNEDIRARLDADAVPAGWSAPLSALWWAGRGAEGWDRAHVLVQDEPGADAAWVHAHLHRAEGDAENAAYWYGRAGRPAAEGALADERAAIASALCATRPDR